MFVVIFFDFQLLHCFQLQGHFQMQFNYSLMQYKHSLNTEVFIYSRKSSHLLLNLKYILVYNMKCLFLSAMLRVGQKHIVIVMSCALSNMERWSTKLLKNIIVSRNTNHIIKRHVVHFLLVNHSGL